MSPEELPGLLEAIRDRAAKAAAPAATAMAETFTHHVTRVTLRRSFTPPGAFSVTPRGDPPAWMTGALASSFVIRPGRGVIRATASSGPTVIYARTQEYGAIHRARHMGRGGKPGYMHWVNSGGSWFMREVNIGPHPYMRPAVAETVAGGSLHRAALAAFQAVTGL